MNRDNLQFVQPVWFGTSNAKMAPSRESKTWICLSKPNSLLYHDLLDCDTSLQTNSSRYICQIAR